MITMWATCTIKNWVYRSEYAAKGDVLEFLGKHNDMLLMRNDVGLKFYAHPHEVSATYVEPDPKKVEQPLPTKKKRR